MSGIDIRSVPEPECHVRPAPPEIYDLHSALPFVYLIGLGLCENHRVLDVGCGSLGVGRLLIPWLLPKMYCGVDALQYTIDRGLQYEIGHDILAIKRPVLWSSSDFDLERPGGQFDFVLASSTLCHMPLTQIKKCLAAVGRVLKPDGLFLFSVYLCKQDEDWPGEPLAVTRFVCHTEKALADAAADCGLSLLRANLYSPVQQVWMICSHMDYHDLLVPASFLAPGPPYGEVLAPKRAVSRRGKVEYKELRSIINEP